MSTHSEIAVMDKKGNIKSIYCHFDGYIENNGVLLLLYYNNINTVNELINLGNISSLGRYVDHINEELKTIAYVRDRGEDQIINRPSTKTLSDIGSLIYDYSYLFKEDRNKWYMIDKENKKLVPLESTIKKLLKNNALDMRHTHIKTLLQKFLQDHLKKTLKSEQKNASKNFKI